MTFNLPRHLICVLVLSFVVVSPIDALPLYKYIDSDGTQWSLEFKCVGQCSEFEWSADQLLPKKNPPQSPHPSKASLHAEMPPPWYTFITDGPQSAAPFHASVPPPWYELTIGGSSLTSQSSNNAEANADPDTKSVGSGSESVSVSNAQGSMGDTQPTVATGSVDEDVNPGGAIMDLFAPAEVAAIGSVAFTSECAASSDSICTPGDTAVFSETATVQGAGSGTPAPAQNVPEPTSVGLLVAGLMVRLVCRRK